jgi:hypothetical protein
VNANLRPATDPWADQDKDVYWTVPAALERRDSKPLQKSTPTSNGQDMAARIDAIAGLGKRFTGANSGDVEAEKDRIKFLVADTMNLPLDVLQIAIREGASKVWKFMPTASEIFEAAQDELRHRRDMQRIDATLRTPAPRALPAPPPREITGSDIAKLNEWGGPLGISWDASGKMMRSETRKGEAMPLERREKATATPQAADYAELRERIAAAVPAVSDASPGLRHLAERMRA